MSSDILNRLLFCILCIILHRMCTAQGANDLATKVALMLHVEPEDPKCFAEDWRGLTCFWEEDEERARPPDQYTFTYTYQSMNSSRCAVTALPAEGAKRLYFCRLSQTQFFAPLDIKVDRDGLLIHNRTLLVELVFLLDPPTNLTVVRAEQQGQLRVRWRPPPLKYMDDSMMYEVSYTAAGRRTGQVEQVKAGSELVLRGLQPGTRYKVQVRVKLDGISYNGYWSAWTKPAFMDTLPPGLDPLIMSLSLIITVILTLLSLAGLLSHRRFLLKKIWPVIPTPDSKFQGLFTVYGGDFQEWLGNSSGGLWLTPAFFYPDEVPAPLEVLSEVSPAPGAPPPKTSAAPAQEAEGEGEEDEGRRGADEGEREGEEDEGRRRPEGGGGGGGGGGWVESGHDHWLIEQLRALHQHPAPPRSLSSRLESQDAYVTLDAGRPGGTAEEAEPPDDILEETLPLQGLFASGRSASESPSSDLGSLQRSSGSGRLSSRSSFEYPDPAWPSRGPAYIYMAVTDSGVSMDYSPMSSGQTDLGKRPAYANEYKNDVPLAHRRPDVLGGQPVHS